MQNDARPARLAYRWPAEWEPHEATWLAWPRNRETWPGKFDVIPPVFAEFVRTLAQFEPVRILAGSGAVMSEAESFVGEVPNVSLFDIPTNDAWTRDHGPLFLKSINNEPAAMVDFLFNAWGQKYPPWDADNAVPRRIAARLNMRRFTPGLVLEGGSIDGNGEGTILTTESCLLSPDRNPTMSRKIVEQYLREYACATRVVWLSGRGILGDDTDGHVDQLARFVDPNTVLCAVSSDATDEQFQPLNENVERLRQHGFKVLPLVLPSPKFHERQRLPASYCNFYIANNVVIVPQFSDPADAAAIELLAAVFPGRDIIGLPAIDLVWGLGSYHCLSMQQPVA